LTNNAIAEIGQLDWQTDARVADAGSSADTGSEDLKKWYVLWTRSHYEQIVFDQLHVKGFHPFSPRLDVWSRRGGIRYRSSVPMFPGYVFLHHVMDKVNYIEILKTMGLARILGRGWGQFATVPDREIEAIERLMQTHLSTVSHPYLREGQRVRVTHGPLMGVEGILVNVRSKKGLLVLSVNLLQRSVAIELDCTYVKPA
jgi:transcriptional antiterminator NusG